MVDLLDAADYDALFGEATLELMFYEATNALWQFAARRQTVSREEGAALVGQLADLRSEMRVVHLADLTAARVYEAAWDTSLTVYDSAYVVAADEYDLTLVTTDGGIHAPDGVDVVQLVTCDRRSPLSGESPSEIATCAVRTAPVRMSDRFTVRFDDDSPSGSTPR